jgi:hypothetical protein
MKKPDQNFGWAYLKAGRSPFSSIKPLSEASDQKR